MSLEKSYDKIPLTRPCVGIEELNAMSRVLESRYITQGPVVKQFESLMAKHLGVKHAIAVNSCTSAIHLAILAAGIGSGDEVITTPFTFPATSNAVLLAGATPVFIDIALDNYNLDPSAIETAITPRTKAILVVHLFGQSADMNAIMDVATRRGILVIEDAACCIGAKYDGKNVGCTGDIGCFSFHPRKILTTGEGGLMITNNEIIAKVAKSLKDHGKVFSEGKLAFELAGHNFRMSDILAAVGIEQLKKLDWMLKRRKELAEIYNRKLICVDQVSKPKIIPLAEHTYQTYVTLLDESVDRDQVIKKLAEKRIEAQLGTYALHLQPTFGKIGYSPGDFPNAELAFKQTLALPLYPQMTEEDIDCVVEALREALQ